MAVPFLRFQSFCSIHRKITTTRRRETTQPSNILNNFLVNQKLEKENHNKGLTLDPQRNHPTNHHYQALNSRDVEEKEEEDQEQSKRKIEYATLPEKMEEAYHHHHHHQQQRRTTSSRTGLKSAGGEIVQVQGGHIVRATGRKDRHSKVCTAKGTRDRRVRLAAHTAIQFYDVQDRLGYDRPSKAVDWLIKKAKAAIDELEELPAWDPIARLGENANPEEVEEARNVQMVDVGGGSSSFLPASMDSDAIADTIKSFFPMGASSETDLGTRDTSQNQDLRLSLQSFQDPMLLHQPPPPPQHHPNQNQTHLGFDSNSGWFEHHQTPTHQRLVAWNSGGDASTASGGGYLFGSPPTPPPPLFGQTQFFTQRGPLQSSNTPSVRAWIDPYSMANHHQHLQQSSMYGGIGFASGGGLSGGFRIPARIQGEEEEHDGVSDMPSSASSDSRH